MKNIDALSDHYAFLFLVGLIHLCYVSEVCKCNAIVPLGEQLEEHGFESIPCHYGYLDYDSIKRVTDSIGKSLVS